MHSRSPGDNIVNYFTGKNCYGQVIFKNGDSITRTRNTEGKNELIYIKDGDESSLTYDTLATAAIQQQKLNKIFDLDWEVFCGSVFFNQYGKPWMEMADSTRKKAIERILHVDRLTYYANAAKARCSDLDLTVSKLDLIKEAI
jgi:DNA repair exonuclease SbcCD ATPase subunit